MSADNWTTCPKCAAKEVEEYQTKVKALKESYGKIPAEEWLREKKLVEKSRNDLEFTLREDYEWNGPDEGDYGDGFVRAIYSASCYNCDFSINIDHKFPYTVE